MKKSSKILAVAVLASGLSTAPMSVPALAASAIKVDGEGKSTSFAQQAATNTTKIKQNAGIKIRPHQTLHITSGNEAYVGQNSSNVNAAVLSEGGESDNTVSQSADNYAAIDQGIYRIMPNAKFIYEGVNTAVVEQSATNANSVQTTGQAKNNIKQTAKNAVEINQGNVVAMPNSELHYAVDNEAYVSQEAANINITYSTDGGSTENNVTQDTSNTAVINQGYIKEFPNSEVYRGGGGNTAVVEQWGGNYSHSR